MEINQESKDVQQPEDEGSICEEPEMKEKISPKRAVIFICLMERAKNITSAKKSIGKAKKKKNSDKNKAKFVLMIKFCVRSKVAL